MFGFRGSLSQETFTFLQQPQDIYYISVSGTGEVVQSREAQLSHSQDYSVGLFDPRTHLLMTTAEMFTCDIKAGFLGQMNQTADIAVGI